MKKLLIVTTTNPLNKYYYERYISGIKKNNGWQVKFWNLLRIQNKKVYDEFNRKGNRIIKDKKNIIFKDYFSLKKEFDKLPKTFFYINDSVKLYKATIIDRMLQIYGGKKIDLEVSGGLPPKISTKVKFHFLLKNGLTFTVKKIFKFLFKLIDNFIKFKIILPKAKIYFVPNKFWYQSIAKREGKSKIRKIHDYAYEVFNKFAKQKRRKKFIVFLDTQMESGFENHMLFNSRPFFNKKEYWSKIENFLVFVNEQFGSEPIIAGSPGRNMFDLPIKNKFFFDKTAELIKDSKLVIVHDSTAIHLAILFKKPILFLTMDVFKKQLVRHNGIKQLSQATGCKMINLDKFSYTKKNFRISEFLKIDKKKYDKFIYDRIKFENSKKIGKWDIIFKELDKEKYF